MIVRSPGSPLCNRSSCSRTFGSLPDVFSEELTLLSIRTHSDLTACKKSFLTNSFTSTQSGAYGLRPAKLNLAVTSSRAASWTFAVRSTTATTRASGLNVNSLIRGFSLVPLWNKQTALLSSEVSVALVEATAKASPPSAAGRILRRRLGTARRLFSSYRYCQQSC